MTALAVVTLMGTVGLAIAGAFVAQRIRARLRQLSAENAALRSELGSMREQVDNVGEKVKKVRTRQRRAFARIDKTDNRLETLREATRGMQHVRNRQDGLVKLSNELRSEVSKTKAQLAQQRDRADGQSRLSTELRDGLAEARATSRLNSRLSGQDIHGSARTLDEAALRHLLQAAPLLGLEWINERQIRYMEHAVGAVEARLRGRLAAPVEAMILRSMVVMASPRAEVEVLEIGTLYGLSACYLHEVVTPQKAGFHQTIVDPFMGYYEQGAPDLFTPIPISAQVVVENFARVGASPNDYELVVGLSEDASVRAQLAEKRFDVVVIDGDHSYDGVRRDFENYAGHVVDGGFVIIDDYQGPSWPDVTRYVDETVLRDPRFELVSGELRTAVVRRIATTDS